MDKKKINIPFGGFYESFADYEIGHQIEQFIEHQNTPETMAEAGRMKEIEEHEDLEINYNAIRQGYAKEYVSFFVAYLADELGINLALEFESMDSPREYNFHTDRIFCLISEADIAKLYNLTDKKLLEATIIERHSSGSGFVSFYSTDAGDWTETPVKEWDHNMLCTLMESAIKTAHGEELLDSPDYELLNTGNSGDRFREKVSEIVHANIKIKGAENENG